MQSLLRHRMAKAGVKVKGCFFHRHRYHAPSSDPASAFIQESLRQIGDNFSPHFILKPWSCPPMPRTSAALTHRGRLTALALELCEGSRGSTYKVLWSDLHLIHGWSQARKGPPTELGLSHREVLPSLSQGFDKIPLGIGTVQLAVAQRSSRASSWRATSRPGSAVGKPTAPLLTVPFLPLPRLRKRMVHLGAARLEFV